MEDSLALNIVYLPDEKTRQMAIEMSQKVASKLPCEFVLGKDKLPHITIYQARFPIKNLEKLKSTTREIASKTRPFEIEMKGFSVVLKTWFWWDCVKTETLAKIHMETIEKLNLFREGLILPRLMKFKGSKEDEEDIKNFGSLLVGRRYSPHITITNLENPGDSQNALKVLGNVYSRFRVDSIALGYLGEHGTVTGIIEEFPLAS